MPNEGQPDLPDGRSIRIRTDVLKKLRVQKGWRVEDLARKAICSRKTVENCEGGKPVMLATLAKLAKALGVEPEVLIDGGVPPAQEPPPGPFIEVNVKLVVPFDRFDETSDLFAFLHGLTQKFGPKGEIVVQGVERGSVTILLGMTEWEDVKEVARLFCALELVDLAVSSVAFPDYEGAVDDLSSWIFHGQPWIGTPPWDLKEGIGQLREHPTARNIAEYKASSTPLGFIYFAVGFDPASQRWSLHAANNPGSSGIAITLPLSD